VLRSSKIFSSRQRVALTARLENEQKQDDDYHYDDYRCDYVDEASSLLHTGLFIATSIYYT
jgi:hypothetical protein